MNYKRLLLLLILFIGTVHNTYSQTNELQLAQQYYAQGAFDKAVVYYEKAYKKDPSFTVFTRYFDCLVQVQDFKKAEKTIQKQIKNDPNRLAYHFQYTDFLERQNRTKEAEKVYQDLIDQRATNTLLLNDLYKSFLDINRVDLAKKTLVTARKKFKSTYPLYLEFAEVNYLEKDYDGAITEMVNCLDVYPNMLGEIKTQLATWVADNEDNPTFQETVKNKLIKSVQKNNDNNAVTDLLIDYFIQRKQFDVALTQVKAIDKREKGNGKRVFSLGQVCLQNKDYETATQAFEYVVNLPDSYLLNDAKRAILQVRYLQITQDKQYDDQILASTIQAYNEATQNGTGNRVNFNSIMELAEIEAYYANHPQRAIQLLTTLHTTQGLTSIQQAEAKMLLADIYVLTNDIWEASMLYMQIDRDFKYEPIGFEAKYKNARIFYYSGDFNFAQSQLDVLKKSTSKLIANDAMKLSILITDNFGLDSNFQAMRLFANADLLLEQHQYDKAFQSYDSIVKQYPESGLMDEIALRKAKAMMDLGRWDKAISFLNEITLYHAYDILMDDALYYLGVIYQEHKNDAEKALENFKKLLMDHPASLHNIEIRERIRNIRNEK